MYQVLKQNKIALTSDYGDIKKMVEHLNHFETNSELIETYGKRAKKFAEQFDRDNVLKTIINEIGKIWKD